MKPPEEALARQHVREPRAREAESNRRRERARRECGDGKKAAEGAGGLRGVFAKDRPIGGCLTPVRCETERLLATVGARPRTEQLEGAKPGGEAGGERGAFGGRYGDARVCEGGEEEEGVRAELDLDGMEERRCKVRARDACGRDQPRRPWRPGREEECDQPDRDGEEGKYAESNGRVSVCGSEYRWKMWKDGKVQRAEQAEVARELRREAHNVQREIGRVGVLLAEVAVGLGIGDAGEVVD